MEMRIGVDIVFVPRFEKLLTNEAFVKKIFHPSESKRFEAEHLAGIFAAKEAFFKAVKEAPTWLDVEIKKEASGKPALVLSNDLKDELSVDVSISHDGEYAIAVVLVKNVD